MAKTKTNTKTAAKKNQKNVAVTKNKGIVALAAALSYFVKITSYAFDDLSDDLTLTAGCRYPPASNPSATVSYYNTSDGSTDSAAANLNGNKISATINLPEPAIYVIEVALVDDTGAILASDSIIYDSENQSTGLQDVGIGPPPP